MPCKLMPGCRDSKGFGIAAHVVDARGDRELKRWRGPDREIPDMEHVGALGDQLAPISRESRVNNRPTVRERGRDGFPRLRVPDSRTKIPACRGDELTIQTELG